MKRLHHQEKASDMLSKALIIEVEERIECANAMLLQAEAFSAKHFKNLCLHTTKIGELKTINIDLQVDLSTSETLLWIGLNWKHKSYKFRTKGLIGKLEFFK